MPGPLDNKAFSELLAKVLHRPMLLRVPKTALRVAFGKELADEALLASCFAVPTAFERLGHRFRHASVEQALRHVLGR
jgi:NAD dependent epimerase/dehydratase family enzyme